MWARIQVETFPMRQDLSFFRGQIRNSNKQIRPPITPKVNPGKLLPLGHSAWPTEAKMNQTTAKQSTTEEARTQG